MSLSNATNYEIAQFCDQILSAKDFYDYCPNGLQLEGRREVTKIGLAVTATQDSIDLALKNGCHMLLVHHGILWRGDGERPYTGPKLLRLKKLIHGDLKRC